MVDDIDEGGDYLWWRCDDENDKTIVDCVPTYGFYHNLFLGKLFFSNYYHDNFIVENYDQNYFEDQTVIIDQPTRQELIVKMIMMIDDIDIIFW